MSAKKLQRIVIGTRGSDLSLLQTDIVRKLILSHFPGLDVVIQVIKTTGDKNMSPIPLDSIGKGWFTKEIDKATVEGSIDLAVHSLKDLPEKLPAGLLLAAIPEREDAREALVATGTITSLAQLPPGAIVGTDSTRRKAQILQARSDLQVKSVRGNVNRRLEKLDSGEYDALLLAVAGLKRLSFLDRISYAFSIQEFVPSPGQGALAIVIHKENTTLVNMLKKINHRETIAAVRAERAFSSAVGGGCKMPVGAYAKVTGDTLHLTGMIGTLSGDKMSIKSMQGPLTKPVSLGKMLAKQIIAQSPWYEVI